MYKEPLNALYSILHSRSKLSTTYTIPINASVNIISQKYSSVTVIYLQEENVSDSLLIIMPIVVYNDARCM